MNIQTQKKSYKFFFSSNSFSDLFYYNNSDSNSPNQQQICLNRSQATKSEPNIKRMEKEKAYPSLNQSFPKYYLFPLFRLN